jgi:hypothetical protein
MLLSSASPSAREPARQRCRQSNPGSTADGRVNADRELTCANWTSSTTGNAMVGHHDRVGLRDDDASKSWNASHPSRDCTRDCAPLAEAV